MIEDPPALPPIDSGPELLREGIKAKGETEGQAAVETFHVRPPTLSGWINRAYKPNGEHQDVAESVYGVPRPAWDDEEQRARRLERLKKAATASTLATEEAPAHTAPKRERTVPPPPPSRPTTKKRRASTEPTAAKATTRRRPAKPSTAKRTTAKAA